MMTSAQIRQSYLDFFRSKEHTLVPSSSLMPDSPNLLFTNAGMNQFVPIFLGERKADVSKWGGAIAGSDTRAADTQKCIRAGGKHNDLDDVGLDTYHHTFFEMLGNWSFGDYFKKEAIDWAWELVVGIWKFPPQRVYATIYNPDKSKGDPSERDEEAWGYWAEKFRAAGLDPAVHIVNGNKKDNFWMMGDTGPCGPCSELHIDLTPNGDTKGALVNKGSPECIEIWNLVFIQFNANPDGTFSPLPAKHVDTGMGFERVTSIIQGTKGFADFANAKISNYETDIFRPIFDEIEKHSGKKYGSTLPKPGSTGDTEQEKVDVAFRVIADHIRTLSFAVADGIQPGNNDRNYVLRRILRRAVRYGRTLGFREPFFYKLVDVLARTMGDVFPEIRTKQQQVKDVLKLEEEAFNKTLDRGIEIFETRVRFQTEILPKAVQELQESSFVRLTREDLKSLPDSFEAAIPTLERVYDRAIRNVKELNDKIFGSIDETGPVDGDFRAIFIGLADSIRKVLENRSDFGKFNAFVSDWQNILLKFEIDLAGWLSDSRKTANQLPAIFVFRLYDTFGFPLDLTELMARERGLTVDTAGFNVLMDEQRARARAAQKKTIIELAESMAGFEATKFVGYDQLEVETEFSGTRGVDYFATKATPFYAEMGGQVGDSGSLTAIAANGESRVFRIVNTTKTPNGVFLHLIDKAETNLVLPGDHKERLKVRLAVDASRRAAIQRHHSVTHLLHWALHQVASQDASQKGSSVTPEKLTFDFNSAALTASQLSDIERLVNERILENGGVSWSEVPYADIKGRKDVMQFFGDKYGDVVRVVQIGGRAGQLDGYDMELCGGTHVRATGEIGQFRILSEGAVAAGVRRIEAVAGLPAFDKARNDEALIRAIAGRLNSPFAELEKKVETLLAHQKELEKSLKAAAQREAAGRAKDLVSRVETVQGVPVVLANLGEADGDTLQGVADALKGLFQGVIVLGGHSGGSVALIASVSPEFVSRIQAGKTIQAIAPIVGGKGGGKPDNARGGGKDPSKIDEALAKVRSLLG